MRKAGSQEKEAMKNKRFLLATVLLLGIPLGIPKKHYSM
jgi:hypothetical protein